MTGEEVRDLGYMSWRDPLAWMERMKGPRWNRLVEKERAHFHKLSKQPRVERLGKQMEREITDAQQYTHMDGFVIGGGAVRVILTGRDEMYWKWSWGKTHTRMDDIEVQGTRVWYVTNNDDVAYDNRLICEDAEGKRHWTKSDVSSQVAVILPYCYYVRTLNYFRAIEVCVCDAYTGADERVLYREKDEEKDLILHKTTNQTLYMTSENANESKLYEINARTITPIFGDSLFQMPLGKGMDGKDCVLTKQCITDTWVPHGMPVQHWSLPSEEVQWINLLLGLVVTSWEGSRTVWFCAPHKRPQVLFRVASGSIEPDEWSPWERSIHQMFVVKTPFQIPYLISITNRRIVRVENQHRIHRALSFSPLVVHRFHTLSEDKTRVPYVTICEKGKKPSAIFVYVYGAYGDTTPIMWPYQTWYPLLKRGWAIVYAMVRGGGDKNTIWADAARRNHRHLSVDDYEAVIRAAQKQFHVGPDKTVIYGRSAGGVPVGAMVSRYPKGDLMGAAFTEVPYVDVLRTTTNPDLPLTKGEYKEFGNPRESILDMKEILSISPVHTLPPEGAPGVFVLTHVGLLDKQVFAYESFKWIHMLRGEDMSCPKGKYVMLEKHEAHQYKSKHMPHFRGGDLAIIIAWAEQTLHLA